MGASSQQGRGTYPLGRSIQKNRDIGECIYRKTRRLVYALNTN